MKANFSTIVFSIVLFCVGCNTAEKKQATIVKKQAATVKPAGDTAVKHIYITFDDGPLEGSEDIDDAVRKEQIKVNVFVVGQHALSDERMKGFLNLYENNPYIEVGNHSYSHAHDRYKKYYQHPDSVVNDFLKCQSALGLTQMLARQPGRNQWRLKGVRINDVNSGSKSADLLFQKGFKVFGWDVEWQHDAKTGEPIQTVDDMVSLIEKKFQDHKTVKPNNLILLAHDEMFRNGWEESELKELIDKLKAKGNYEFDHLSSYPD